MTPAQAGIDKAIAEATSPAEAAKAARMPAALGVAAAWAPNPKNPPLYLDLAIKDGQPQQEIRAKWYANAALDMVDQYIGNLRQYRAIGVEVGDKDTGRCLERRVPRGSGQLRGRQPV